MSAATWITGDTLTVLRALPDSCVDLVVTSPPFLALRSYLPADDPMKGHEIGGEATPGAFLDVLLDVTEELGRVLTPTGSLCVELGDTYSGSGGGGGDYLEGGMREGQAQFAGSAASMRESNAAHWRQKNQDAEAWPLAKSLALIPESYRFALAYGRNPHTGRETDPWRIRNVVRWCRPNPPVGALGDKFRPATSEMVVACKSGQRWFDLDAVREPHKRPADANSLHHGEMGDDDRRNHNHGKAAYVNGGNEAGAPPLDWWDIPTAPENVYQTDSGVLIVGGGETARQVRVQVGVPGDGIRHTVSPDCPVHGSEDHPGSSAPGGGRAGSGQTRSGRSGARPVQGPPAGSPPTSLTGDPKASSGSPAGPSAKPRSSSSSRTAPAPETTTPDTPSAGTAVRTGGTSGSPESSEPDPGNGARSTSGDGSVGSPGSRTSRRTDGTPPSPESSGACTCSYWVEVEIPQDTSDYAGYPPDYWNIPTYGYAGSHYATFPPALVVRPVEAMCPREVCRVCGEPRRRIAETVNAVGKAVGRASWDNGTDGIGAGHSGEIAVHASDSAVPDVAERRTLGWSDCGHGDYRPGRTLDPFAGSGTTLAVATGHGRDAIGIDLDARNADLARDRIGMWFTEATPQEAASWLDEGRVPGVCDTRADGIGGVELVCIQPAGHMGWHHDPTGARFETTPTRALIRKATER